METIVVNVRGKKFEVYKDNLIKLVYFRTLFDFNDRTKNEKSNKNELFIDRDPKLFKLILNYITAK